MSDRIHPWRELARERAFQSRVFEVSRRRMEELGDGGDVKRGEFVRIEAPDWVNVVALTEDRQLVLIEQWRHGVDRVTLEIPGGMIDPGEDALAAARRELAEETGYSADTWTRIGSIEPNPALQANRCHTFLAEGARRTQAPRFDGHERCRLILAPYDEAPRLVASGRITHALVVVGLHFARLREEGLSFADAPREPSPREPSPREPSPREP